MDIRRLILILLITSLFNFIYVSADNPNPKNVKPIRYTLTIETNMDVKDNCTTFNGSVVIELFSYETANNITLNVKSVDINNHTIKIVHSSGSELEVVNVELDEKSEFFIIHLQDELLENEYYNLTIEEFSGIMTYDNAGFYLGKYTTKDGEERSIGITDFEAKDARKAFPCFDDPSMKAKFIINIIRPANYFAISNEELVSTQDLENGRFMDTFKETMIMPTYVVAYLVSDYKHTQKIERHRVFAPPDAIDDGKLDYALSVAVETLKALEEYTDLNYTNTKMDQVAIPGEYFHDQAMENWGMVTFSDIHLFISNDTSSIDDIERCTTYIAHEFAHQWFGNLVTFREWRYLWLSEGISSFFQYYGASLVRPSWRLMDRFVVTILQKLFEFDSTNSTTSMNIHIQNDPYLTMWICYRKGSVVIRMAQHFLTFDIFRKGIHHYLEENKFKNAEPRDLYLAFQAIIDEEGAQGILGNNSVESIMKTWDSTEGSPLVTVHRNYDSHTITLFQKRYSEEQKIENNNVWYIPISSVCQLNPNKNFSDTRADIWLTTENMTFVDEYKGDGWFLINKQQAGYYRVNYDLVNWDRLASFLSKEDYESIHVLNRGQLVDDAFRLARYNKVPYHVPLNLSKYLVRETDYVPIAPFVDALPYITSLMTSSRLYDVYRKYVINLLSTAYDYLGFNETPNDTHLDKFNRINVVEWLCKFGHSECRNDALIKFQEWKKTGKLSVDPLLKQSVLCNAMRIANIDDWEFLYEKAANDTKTGFSELYTTLACTENKYILYQYLNRLLDSTYLINIAGRGVFNDILLSSDVGPEVALHFIRNSSIPKKLQTILVYDLSESFTTEEQLKELQLLNTTVGKEVLESALNKVSKNIKSMKNSHREDIENWFNENFVSNMESSNAV